MKKPEIIYAVILLLLGVALTVVSILGCMDGFWSGSGTALLVIGIARLLRGYRLSRNETYREKRAVAETDERLHFISRKAWTWAGALFILIAAACTFLFKLLGQQMLFFAAAAAMFLMVALYWVAFLILNKKY